MTEPTTLEFVIAQLRHAYQQLVAHDNRWSRRGMREFADGLIAPQIRALERLAHVGGADASPSITLELKALMEKWLNEADEIEADGDVCCAITRRHDAVELAAVVDRVFPRLRSQDRINHRI